MTKNAEKPADDQKPTKPRKKGVRKPLYVLLPTHDGEDAPYSVQIVPSKAEVRKAIEAAGIDGTKPVALSRVIVLRADKVKLEISTQTIIRF